MIETLGFLFIGIVIGRLIYAAISSNNNTSPTACNQHTWVYKDNFLVCNLCGRKPGE